MAAAGVPTAEALAVARPPCVVKVDGLAAGKGVFICETAEQLDEGLRAASAFDGPIVIEELLEGDEISVFALSDGHHVVPLAPAQDFKRIGDGDTGPNTGGMGSFSPVAGLRRERGRGARGADPPAGRRGARPSRRAVRRGSLRRADADGVRAEGARVQRALRRPGDAVDPAAPRRRPPRRARCRGGRGSRGGRARRLRRRRGDRRARGRRLSGAVGRRHADRGRSKRRRRPARSSSTPEQRCAATSWSRTAAASSASRGRARRSPRPASRRTRAARGFASRACSTGATSRWTRPPRRAERRVDRPGGTLDSLE